MRSENEFLRAVEQQVREHPQAPAHKAPNGLTTTYAELWEASDRIAAALAARTEKRQPAVVLGHKSACMVAGFLGCLKSGHAFVPVDTEMPLTRLADILSQLGEALVVVAEDMPDALACALPESDVLDARAAVAAAGSPFVVPDRASWVTGDETQYLIFTSGSTGRPKGIEVGADNVARFMDWVCTFPVIREGGRVFLDQPPYSFDLSEYEVVGALATGGCLHAVEREEAEDLRALFADLRDSGVEVWTSTPSFADLCLADRSFDEALLPDVRLFLFCGEALRRSTAAALRERFPRARIANTYGPTESTVAVTYVEIGDSELVDERPLPVGRPRPGTELRIVDPETGDPVPDGEMGELVLTPLGKQAIPVLRYRTHDLTRVVTEPCACGRTTARMQKVRARSDDMLIIRGTNVFPSQVEDVLAGIDGVTPHYRIVVESAGGLDRMTVHVELKPEAFSDSYEDMENLRRSIEDKLKGVLLVGVKAKLVEPGGIERSTGKTKHVEDLRK